MVRLPETVSVLAELAYMSNSRRPRCWRLTNTSDAGRQVAGRSDRDLPQGERSRVGYVVEPRVFNPLPGISADACEDPDLG